MPWWKAAPPLSRRSWRAKRRELRKARRRENVEYVDTSAYESYEKQEGDFVEPSEVTDAEQPVQAEGESES